MCKYIDNFGKLGTGLNAAVFRLSIQLQSLMIQFKFRRLYIHMYLRSAVLIFAHLISCCLLSATWTQMLMSDKASFCSFSAFDKLYRSFGRLVCCAAFVIISDFCCIYRHFIWLRWLCEIKFMLFFCSSFILLINSIFKIPVTVQFYHRILKTVSRLHMSFFLTCTWNQYNLHRVGFASRIVWMWKAKVSNPSA